MEEDSLFTKTSFIDLVPYLTRLVIYWNNVSMLMYQVRKGEAKIFSLPKGLNIIVLAF